MIIYVYMYSCLPKGQHGETLHMTWKALCKGIAAQQRNIIAWNSWIPTRTWNAPSSLGRHQRHLRLHIWLWLGLRPCAGSGLVRLVRVYAHRRESDDFGFWMISVPHRTKEIYWFGAWCALRSWPFSCLKISWTACKNVGFDQLMVWKYKRWWHTHTHVEYRVFRVI